MRCQRKAVTEERLKGGWRAKHTADSDSLVWRQPGLIACGLLGRAVADTPDGGQVSGPLKCPLCMPRRTGASVLG